MIDHKISFRGSTVQGGFENKEEAMMWLKDFKREATIEEDDGL